MQSIPLIALVTGASRRIGRTLSLALADAGFDLLLHARTHTPELQALVEAIGQRGRRAYPLLADLTQPDACTALANDVQALTPHLSLLVHNASIFVRRPLEDLSAELIRETLVLNLEAPLLLTQALLPLLRSAHAPSLVFLSDILAGAGMRGASHYCASKAGLEGLIRALAVELAPAIRVNGVAPGTVFFPEDYPPEAFEQLVERIPLARPGDPADIARAVVFLALQAPYVTGQILQIDGGRSVRL